MIIYKPSYFMAVLDRSNNNYFTCSNKFVLGECIGVPPDTIKGWFVHGVKTKRYKQYEIINLDGHYKRKSNKPGRHISDLPAE